MKTLKRLRFVPLLLALCLVVMVAAPVVGMAAEAPVDLGRTRPFAVLANTGISNVPAVGTVINGDAGGDIGVSGAALTAITGFPPGTYSGTAHGGDQTAIDAQTDLVAAYNDAAGRPITTTLGGVELGGRTLGPGVYDTGGVLNINGTLTLDGKGDPNSVFIFKSTSTLIAEVGSTVRLINKARYCRVFWVVPSSATIMTNATFVGHVFAMADIQAQNGASVQGQLLARTGAVTLDNNRIMNGLCATQARPGPTPRRTPGLPKTGYPPERQTFPWQLTLGVLSVLGASLVLLLIARRRVSATR